MCIFCVKCEFVFVISVFVIGFVLLFTFLFVFGFFFFLIYFFKIRLGRIRPRSGWMGPVEA